MAKNLLIVESPAKAKTIEKYLGKDFSVKSSYGHVRDLEKNGMGVDIDHDFTPKYVVTPDKRKVVKDLKTWVKKVDEVWLATDEDREGEAISWHLCQVLGLDEQQTKRIVFREITKPAIQQAIEKPRRVDMKLVYAQQARRILDRLVGFELSEILWRKVKGKLSAGRVQSVAVKLIVDKEREIQEFNASGYYKLTAQFEIRDEAGKVTILKAELPGRFESKEDAVVFLNRCIGASFKIADITVSPFKKRPSAPFTTSTLQQEASRKYGFSVKRTMSVAQKLYERGFITYMRTDSTNLSETALQSIAGEIQDAFGQEYLFTRRFATKKALAQEAHEAIRPTYIQRKSVSGEKDLQRLYELIWKRTIASQMADARLERTKVSIGISTIEDQFLEAKGEVLKFDGFLKVYFESRDDENDENNKSILPPVHKGQQLYLNNMSATEKFTKPPARYTEAGLVKKLEELGIGRPSTYAPTISKIMEEARGYVVKESRPGVKREFISVVLKDNTIAETASSEMAGSTSNRLYPTDMGMLVTDFLSEHFRNVMNYNFTAEIEKKFDIIADGDLSWNEMISNFYSPFHKTVEETLETATRARGKRILGTDPKSGYTVLTQMTRFGPVVQIGTKEEVGEEGKPKFANFRPGQSLETIDLEEALKLFELPRELGEYEGEQILIGIGRFGPYVKYKDAFISLPKGADPMEFPRAEAIQLIQNKQKEALPVAQYKGKPVTKGQGRFGPYIKWDGLFVNVPKKYNFNELTSDQINELIEAKINKEANRYIQRWEKEKISIENGRWGPFIRKGRKPISFPKINGKKLEAEDAKQLSLEEVKKIINGEIPESLKKRLAAKE
jgi:DNA topoisomerase-1